MYAHSLILARSGIIDNSIQAVVRSIIDYKLSNKTVIMIGLWNIIIKLGYSGFSYVPGSILYSIQVYNIVTAVNDNRTEIAIFHHILLVVRIYYTSVVGILQDILY